MQRVMSKSANTSLYISQEKVLLIISILLLAALILSFCQTQEVSTEVFCIRLNTGECVVISPLTKIP
jgi:hypothetical protein